MTSSVKKYLCLMVVRSTLMLIALPTPPCFAKNDFAQIIMPFNSTREYKYSYDQIDNALVIEMKATSPKELEALNHYDEDLVRRVLIKDLGGSGTEVRVVLRDRNVRATVGDFTDPFRISIDLYDHNFKESRDESTGFPLAGDSNKGAEGIVASQDRNSPNENTGHATPTDEKQAAGGRRLLQQSSPLFVTPSDMSEAMTKIDSGVGHEWTEFPVYIYRLQSVDSTSDQKKSAGPAIAAAMTSSSAMSDYAAKLYDLGHENRAQIAYQQILHKDPQLFSRDPVALLKFAEVHLGQGNLTLSEVYNSALAERHRSHILSRFAALRGLDIQAIRAIRENRLERLQPLATAAAKISTLGSSELATQVAIRSAFWKSVPPASTGRTAALPVINDDVRKTITSNITKVESQRTAFVAASLLMADLVRPDSIWNPTQGEFAANYFQRYTGKATEPFRDSLKEALQNKLKSVIQVYVQQGKFIEAIQTFESLPKALQSIKKVGSTAWSLAEAYRNLGNKESATQHYEVAADASNGPDRLRSQFWLAVVSAESASTLKESNGGQTRINSMLKKSADADRAMGSTWEILREDEQKTAYIALKSHLEAAVSSPDRLKTPPKIVLTMWTKGMPSRATTSTGTDATDWSKNFSATSSASRLLTDLGNRFGELGMAKEKRSALQLLRNIKPANMEQDKESRNAWAQQLIGLAEDYRTSNEYLEAGRIYTFVGSESENWEGRAEALYKGGLLLYRSGRREEAVDAFNKAKADGNNLFYANLANERLNQIETK